MSETKGLTNPTFIIKSGDTYYLTTGVLEYDKAKVGNNLTQERGVAEVMKAYADSAAGDSTARQVVFADVLAAAQTGNNP